MPARAPSLVSVVIPSHDGARFVGETIESVLTQTHPAIETIVVDDGSTDDTPRVIAAYGDRVRYVRQANAGPAAARNAGLRESHGSYLTFLDHDDRLHPTAVARRAEQLDMRPDLGVAYCGWRYVDADGRPLPATGWPCREGDVLADLVLGNLISPSAALVRRELVVGVGGFDDRLKGGEDWDLWLRISSRGARWACVDEALLDYRVHAASRSQSGVDRQLTNRLALLGRLFADLALPTAVRALEDRAYHNVYLRAAIDYTRGGDRDAASAALHEAARRHPSTLTEPRSLHDICRRLLPPAYRHQEFMADEAPQLTRLLRQALRDLFARPDLDAGIARVRWRAHLAAMRVTTRLLRKHLLARAVRPGDDAAPWRIAAAGVGR
jgi:glycosyltransferase involved in cell wall biosynthesis